MINMKRILCGFISFVFVIPCLAFSGVDIKQSTAYTINTSEGKIAISDSQPDGSGDEPTVIFIHGHLTHRGFFASQMHSPLLAKYRLVSLDLPGYGDSGPSYLFILKKFIASLDLQRSFQKSFVF